VRRKSAVFDGVVVIAGDDQSNVRETERLDNTGDRAERMGCRSLDWEWLFVMRWWEVESDRYR
jgi:hypothetical protein